MKQVRCPNCGFFCQKYGKTRYDSQRWHCKQCKFTFTNSYDKTVQSFQSFLKWLFSKGTQKGMVGQGRSFRRHTAMFWEYWALPPKVEMPSKVIYVDGIYLARKACILIACNDTYVLGWYLCRYENARAWEALLNRIAAPIVVVTDGGTGFHRAVKKAWPKTKLQRCIFHAFQQVKRYTTTRPKTIAGVELYGIAKELFHIKTQEDARLWVQSISAWKIKHRKFLAETTTDDNGTIRPKHERLLKAENSLNILVRNGNLFTYINDAFDFKCPSTNNRIEGGINAQLRAVLRNHRGMTIEKRIKAVFWWCYMHSPNPLSLKEILEVMPTNKSISTIYNTMNERSKLEASISTWGDAIVWSDLHFYDKSFNSSWD